MSLEELLKNGGGQIRTDVGVRRKIYSLLQLAAMRLPPNFYSKCMLEKGLEPSTIRLQVGRSTN